jgi:hypothetical protein
MTVQPNVVRDYYIGNTHIKIADNYYANKTAEDVKQILRDVAKKAQRSLSAEAVYNGYDVKR